MRAGMRTKKLQTYEPLRHVVISQQSWCLFFANRPCIASICKLFTAILDSWKVILSGELHCMYKLVSGIN